MNRKELLNERDRLEGNMNRMFITSDLEELLSMYTFAKCRLEQIFNGNYMRLKEEEREKTEE